MSRRDNDPVNHPSHYTQGKVECIEAIESALGPQGFVAFLRGQVIKYNWRMTHKNNPQQDAEKAAWYQDRLVQATNALFISVGPNTPPPTQQGQALTDEQKVEKHYERAIAARERHYDAIHGTDSGARPGPITMGNFPGNLPRDPLDPRTNDGS